MVETSSELVTISGLPGSGTSTVAKMLSEQTGWQHLDAGGIFRDMAAAAELSLAEFGVLAEQDPEVDRGLDARMIQAARQRTSGLILEGRITGWMVNREGIRAFTVWLQADPESRAERVSIRDGQELEEAFKAMELRQKSERQRYRIHHNIDIEDVSIYDFILDSALEPAAAVTERIAQRLHSAASSRQRS